MTDGELRAEAKEIAQSMRDRDLKAWYAKYEVRNRATPPMYAEKLIKLIEEEFNQ